MATDPTFGLPTDLFSIPTDVLDSAYPYYTFPYEYDLKLKDLQNDLDIAKTQASAQLGAARTQAEAARAVAEINRLSEIESLLPQLAVQMQMEDRRTGLEVAKMAGSGNLFDYASSQYWLANQGGQPALGSAFAGVGGMPNLTNRPLAEYGTDLKGLLGQLGIKAGGSTSSSTSRYSKGGGALPSGVGGGSSGGINYNFPGAAIPTYSAANGISSFGGKRSGNYDILTGDRQLMSTGVPSGNEEIVRVGPNNRIQGVMPLNTAQDYVTNPNTGAQYTRSGYRVPGTGSGGNDGGGGGNPWRNGQAASNWQVARMRAVQNAGGGAPATFLPGEVVGNRPISPPLSYGDDVVATDIGGLPSSLAASKTGLEQVAGLRPTSSAPTLQDILKNMIAAQNAAAGIPLISAAEGFSPDAPSLPNLGSLPIFDMINGNNTPLFQGLNGQNTASLPELGIGQTKLPFAASNAYLSANDYWKDQMLQGWQLFGIPPALAQSWIYGSTPGAVQSSNTALSY